MTFYVPQKLSKNTPIEEKECFICWIILFAVILSTLGYAMYKTMQATDTVKYDCRMATYPTAVDVPQEVIKKCRGLL
jgi:hypothetical protein